MTIVPADETVAELKAKLEDCERRIKDAAEPAVALLKEESELYQKWIAVLESGKWSS